MQFFFLEAGGGDKEREGGRGGVGKVYNKFIWA